MKRNKTLKKFIMGTTGLVMASVMFFTGTMHNMQEVEADVRVFDRITEQYPDSNKFEMKILEIVPDGYYETNATKTGTIVSAQVHSRSEIGYFLPLATESGQQPWVPTITSRGGVHGMPIATRNDPEYENILLRYRSHGLVRPFGADSIGAYPIYAVHAGGTAGLAIFDSYRSDVTTEACQDSYVKGVYEMGQGDYNIAEGYTIDDNGTICKIEIVPVVSENSTISENNPTYDPVTNTVKNYIPVPEEEMDLSQLSLPRAKTGEYYITQADPAGSGNVKFTRSEGSTTKTQYYGFSDQVLYYLKKDNVDFYNSDYFREFVLGSRSKYKDRNIEYTVKNANKVTKKDIEEADLVYISGKSADFAKSADTDIKEEILIEIYNKEVNDHKAVMMDYACYDSSATTNVSKLAVLLWRSSQSELKTEHPDSYGTGEDNTLKDIKFLKGDALSDLKSSMLTGGNGNFVTGNVFVYNHHMSDYSEPKSLIDAYDNFANGDFNSSYTANVMQQGFTEVLNYIVATNKNSTSGTMVPAVSPAVAIQYILISDGKGLSIVKSSLNVLEIQPVMSFKFNPSRGSEEYDYLDEGSSAKKNRDEFVEKYLGDYYKDKVEYITFNSMTVDEFNSKNDDLIETYDVIYIGCQMGSLYYTKNMQTATITNGVYDRTKQTEKQLSDFVDSAMNGNVYYNIGDVINKINPEVTGYYEDGGSKQIRYPGRDLTKDKLNKLINYLDAECLVLVEGDMYAGGVVNPTACFDDNGRVDTSSYMYEFLQYANGYRFNPDGKVAEATAGSNVQATYVNASAEGPYKTYPNLISIADIETKLVDKSATEQYVATEKLFITLTEQPQEYAYQTQTIAGKTQVIEPTSVKYMEETAGQARALRYSFIISSDYGTGTESLTYTPYLFVDVNNDGKFSKTAENIRDMQIVVKASGEEAAKDSNNNYVLYKDVEYQMIRELDETFSGYLKWKISIQSNLYTNSHASEQGYTVVKNKGADELIKILQITRGGKNADGTYNKDNSNLDLQQQNASDTSLFGKYLASVPGYKVEIRTMGIQEFQDDFDRSWATYKADGGVKPISEYAIEYFNTIQIKAPSSSTADDAIIGANMLVLGFGDCYPDMSSTDAVEALQAYMESDRPVLLTHDFIMFWANKNHAEYLRHNVGMDKYGLTQNIKKEITEDGVTVGKLLNARRYPDQGQNLMHKGGASSLYTRSGDLDTVKLIESTGKAVPYQPGSARTKVLGANTQGLTNYTIFRYRDEDQRSFINAPRAADYTRIHTGEATYNVHKMNDGQITSYPYLLPDTFKAKSTHGQYCELDLQVDDDQDGESDVVVWYTLGDTGQVSNSSPSTDYNPWGNEEAGPLPYDGYFIYNKGNITYTGAGHRAMTEELEAQLFVNTLFAAYNAAKTKPSVGFYEQVPTVNDAPISNITVPYDENVTGANAIDSSVLKDASGNYRYHFVNPNVNSTHNDIGTKIYFRLKDTNFVRGKKYMDINYYLKVEGTLGTDYRLDNGVNMPIETLDYNGTTVNVVNVSRYMSTYKVNLNNGAFADLAGIKSATDGTVSGLESGTVYGFYMPLSYLDDSSQVTLYMKAKTWIHTVSALTGRETVSEAEGEGVTELTATKADLIDLK